MLCGFFFADYAQSQELVIPYERLRDGSKYMIYARCRRTGAVQLLSQITTSTGYWAPIPLEQKEGEEAVR